MLASGRQDGFPRQHGARGGRRRGPPSGLGPIEAFNSSHAGLRAVWAPRWLATEPTTTQKAYNGNPHL